MQFANRILDWGELGFGGFNEEQELFGVLDLALPMVDGGDRSEDVDAGSQTPGDEFGGQGIGFFREEAVESMRRLSVIGGVLSRAGNTLPDEVRPGKGNSMP